MKRPTVLELEVALREVALDLLMAAKFGAERLVRDGRRCGYEYNSKDLGAPLCFEHAEHAFAACELLNISIYNFHAALALIPWVGPLPPGVEL